MNSSPASKTNIENIAGAIVFPLLFAFTSFGTAFIPLVGGVVAVGVGCLIGAFAAWCNAPTWCKCTMTLGSLIGFVVAYIMKEGIRGQLIIASCVLGVCLLSGLLLRRRTNSR